MYSNDASDVICAYLLSNKKNSCAGHEWSAGRSSNRPVGAREVAHKLEMRLGPYAINAIAQPHHTGCNTCHKTQVSSRRP